MEKLSTLVISVAVVLLACLLCVVGESDVMNYGGKLFAFSFLADSKPGKKWNTPCMIDLIAADNKNSTIHVTIPGRNFDLTLDLLPGQVERVNLSLESYNLFGNEDATVIVKSTGRIGVVALMELLRPSAAFHVIPAEYTGIHHVIANNYNTRNTQFTITSLSENNTVHVYTAGAFTFECDHFNHSTDNASILLWKYDSMFCRGKGVDLTGTFVISEYNVSVVAGGRVQFFGDTERKGYVMEQMLPQRAWGNHFVIAPFANLNESNYLLKFLAPEGVVANVTIKGLNWTAGFTIEGHEWFNDSIAFDQVVEIIANESVSVMQYMTGTSKGSASNRSDPSMFNVSPLSQAKHNLLVDVFPCENENIINIITKCTHIEGLQVNGTDLKVGDGRVISILNGTTYCTLSYELEAGLHCVSHRNPQASFQIILYSWKINAKGQNAYAMEAALDVPSEYPTCIPVIDENPASQLLASFADLQEDDYCGNDTSFNRPASIAMEIEQLAMNMTARMIDEGTSDIFEDLGVAVIEIRRINSSASNPATSVSIPSNDNSTQPKTRGMISMEILRELKIQALISIVFRNLGEQIDNCSTSDDLGRASVTQKNFIRKGINNS